MLPTERTPSDIIASGHRLLAERRARLAQLELEIVTVRAEVAVLVSLLGSEGAPSLATTSPPSPSLFQGIAPPLVPKRSARAGRVVDLLRELGKPVPQIQIIKHMQEQDPEFTRNHLITIVDRDPSIWKTEEGMIYYKRGEAPAHHEDLTP